MFKEKKEFRTRRLEDRTEELHSVIASGTVFQGDIEGSEGLHISGRIEGTIKSGGLVKVDRGAKIEGPVDAPYLIIEGEIVGDIKSAEQIELREEGKVTGNISTQKLAMAEGSFFQGKIQMADPSDEPHVFDEKRHPEQP